MDDCARCSALDAENALLRNQLMQVTGGVQSTLAFIHSERRKPTISPSMRENQTVARLEFALNSAY